MGWRDVSCPWNPSPSSRLVQECWRSCFLFSFYSHIRLHSEALAAASLDCFVCFGPKSLRQGLPGGGDGGGDGEWPSNHVAILPASGHTEYGPKPKTLPPRDSARLTQSEGVGFTTWLCAWWKIRKPRKLKWYVQGVGRVGIRIRSVLDPNSSETFIKHIQQQWQNGLLCARLFLFFTAILQWRYFFYVYFIDDKLRPERLLVQGHTAIW